MRYLGLLFALPISMKHTYKNLIITLTVCESCQSEVTEICSNCGHNICKPCHDFKLDLASIRSFHSDVAKLNKQMAKDRVAFEQFLNSKAYDF